MLFNLFTNENFYLIGIALIIGSIFLIRKIRQEQQLINSFEMSLFLIRLPKYETDTQQKERTAKEEKIKLIEKMEQIYTNFVYIKKEGIINKIKYFFNGYPKVAMEIVSEQGGSDISFYLAVPNFMDTAIEKYIHGLYPGSSVKRIPEDYTVFEPGGEISCSYLRLKRHFYFPINTYKTLETDPIETIINALTKIKSEEGSAIQIILRPAPTRLKEKGKRVLQLIKEGKTPITAIRESTKLFLVYFLEQLIFNFLSIFFEGFLGAKNDKEKKDLNQDKSQTYEENSFKAIEEKIQKNFFETNIRTIGVGQTKERAEEINYHLENAFSEFLGNFNGFIPIRINSKTEIKRFVYDFSFRNFNKKQNIILNLEELSSIYHFPLSHLETPSIKWIKSKEVAPPADLPEKGVILIGKSIFRGEERPVYFANKDDRRRHFYIIGQTGTGKSTFLRELIRQDIENGQGVGVIDPHGDLIEDTLANIPKQRIQDVVLFEPFDTERPVGLNMLEWETEDQKDFAVQEMIAIFSKLFPPEVIGPMFEHYMRNAMLALMAYKENPGTLVEIPRIFTDDEFMEERLEKVTDPVVRSFWLKEWKKTTGSTKSDMLGYVVSKVGRFVENTMLRNIIGQSHSGFNLAQIMDNKKIFLANLSKGQTGEINSSLLGLILVSKFQMAAMKRGLLPQEQRRDFYLYLDEFQNFTTDSIAVILSEARKYRLNLILAHQYIPQLKDEIKDAVIGNVGTIGTFRIGITDAEFLEKQFEPEFSKFDLVNLDNFQYIAKVMINNQTSSPFKIRSIPPKQGDIEQVQTVKKLSKLKYGRPRFLVEKEIIERSKLGEL